MKASLSELTEEKPADAAAAPDKTVATRPAGTVTTFNDEDASGEFTRDDVDKVYLSIVAKTGELSNLFTPGDFLLNKEFVIGGTKSPIDVIALGIKKRYQNDIPYDPSEDAGDTVDSAVEVAERSGVIGYRPFTDKVSTHFWKPILNVMFLIKRPENVTPDAVAMFPYEINGFDYALVGYTARTKTAYNGIAKPLIQAKLGAKKTVRGSVYSLSTKGETYEDKSWIQPRLRATGAPTEEVLQFIRENNG